MANDLLSNPWLIDTASPVPITRSKIRPATLRWVGATTAGHEVIIKDNDDRIVYHTVAAGSNNVEESQMVGIGHQGVDWNGMTVTTLDSGTLYLTHK